MSSRGSVCGGDDPRVEREGGNRPAGYRAGCAARPAPREHPLRTRWTVSGKRPAAAPHPTRKVASRDWPGPQPRSTRPPGTRRTGRPWPGFQGECGLVKHTFGPNPLLRALRRPRGRRGGRGCASTRQSTCVTVKEATAGQGGGARHTLGEMKAPGGPAPLVLAPGLALRQNGSGDELRESGWACSVPLPLPPPNFPEQLSAQAHQLVGHRPLLCLACTQRGLGRS